MAFGVANIDQVALPVESHQRHEHQRQCNRARAAAQRARQVVPDRRRHGQQNRRRDHGVRAAQVIQKWNQNQELADRALQVHGGMGYSEEYHVARYFREARLTRIAPLSQEMVLNYLGEHVLKLPRSY